MRRHDLDCSEIRCVAFDAVGTLIYPSPPVARVYAETGRKFGSQLGEADVARRLRGAFQRPRGEDGDPHATSETREREFWRSIVDEVLDGVTNPAACFEELFAWFGESRAWRLFDDIGDVLRDCRAAGLKIAVASNFDDRLNGVLDGLLPQGAIDVRVISSAVGYRKPSGKFYSALSKLTGCAPHEIVMVGDDWDADVIAARDAGLNSVWLDRSDNALDRKSIDPPIPAVFSLAELMPHLASRVRT
jgi:putative hydrolase of the HAD superfamily